MNFEKKQSLQSFATLTFLFLILSTNFGANSDWYQYLFFAAVIVLSLPCYNSIRKLKGLFQHLTLVDLIPICFLIIWFYGVCLGFLYQWPLKHVVSNFAGMTIYSVYFFLKRMPGVNQGTILKLALYSVCSNFLVILFLSFPGILNNWSDIISHSVRVLYSVGSLIIFIPAVVSIFLLINHDEMYNFSFIGDNFKVTQLILVYIVTTYILVFNTASKGFLLGWLFLVITVVSLKFIRYFFIKSSFTKKELFALTFIVITAILISFNPGKRDEFPVVNIFSPIEVSNSIRLEQLGRIVEDLTFFGKGLGASIEGYQREPEKTYGVELVYLNTVHKFGFLALIIFMGYFVTLYVLLKNLFQGVNIKASIVALGCMTYLLPSLGNPLLFHPIAVVLHVVALYLISPVWRKQEMNNLIRPEHTRHFLW